MIEMHQLDCFLAVAKSENITSTAREMHITQSTLSKVITRLETTLGISLFYRQKGKIRLNENGKIFYEHVSRMFDELNAGIAAIALSGRSRINSIKIYSALTSNVYLHSAVGLAQASYCDMNLELHDCSAGDMEDKLCDGTADIVIYTSDKPKSVQQRGFWREQWCVMIHQGHPLAGKKAVSMRELVELPVIQWRTRADRNFTFGLLKEENIHPSRIIETHDLNKVLTFSCKMLGTAIVPCSMYHLIRTQYPKIPVKPLLISDVKFVRNVYWGTAPGFPRNETDREIMDFLIAEIDAMNKIVTGTAQTG